MNIKKVKLTDADSAYTKIKQKIITTELPPGSVINESELMDEFGLGRTPIREAIKRLQSENFVVISPRKGMFVANFAVTDLLQIFEVRIELESLAARLAVQRITDTELKDFQKLAKTYNKKANLTNKDILMRLDREFHSLIANATRNNFLIKELEKYYDLSLRIWYIALSGAQPEDIDITAHFDILDAIKNKEADRAGESMKAHIQNFHETIKKYI